MVYWTAFQLNVLLVYPIIKLILWQSLKKKVNAKWQENIIA